MHKFQIILLFSLFLLGNLAFAQEKEVDYHYFRTAFKHKAKEDYKAAAIDFSIFLKYNPEHYMARYYRGYCYLYQSEFGKAIEDFKELSKLDPLNIDGPFSLGRTYYKMGDYENTVKYYTKAIEINPLDEQSFNGRGVAYCRLNKFDLAIDNFYRAIAINENFAMAYCNAGAARYFNQDIENPTTLDLEAAKEWFEKAIDKDPKLYLAYYNRAAINFFLEKYDESLLDMRKVQTLKPERAMNYFYSGLIYQRKGDYKRAEAEFKKVLQLDPSIPYPLEEMGDSYKQKGDYAQAIIHYKKALNSDYPIGESYHGLLHYRIALIHALSQQEDKMYASLETAQKLGVFKDRKVYQTFLQAEELKPYRSEKEMISFTKKITKGKKESKFLNPDLRWFRMEQGAY